MKYLNAEVVFPEELLKELQQYIQGEVLYIPNREGTRKKWGENSGNRKLLADRNREIRNHFLAGQSIEQLAELFFLSYDSIKKIVYSQAKR